MNCNKYIPTGLAMICVAACGGASLQGGLAQPVSGASTSTSLAAGGSESTSAESPASGPTGQWSVQDRTYWQNLQEDFDQRIGSANNNCGGSQMTFAFAHETFRGHFTEGGNYGMDSARTACECLVSGIHEFCGNGEIQTQAIRDRIRSVVCELGPRRSYALNGTTLHVVVNSDISGAELHNEAEAWLGNNL